MTNPTTTSEAREQLTDDSTSSKQTSTPSGGPLGASTHGTGNEPHGLGNLLRNLAAIAGPILLRRLPPLIDKASRWLQTEIARRSEKL